jgi:hypothetical protein
MASEKERGQDQATQAQNLKEREALGNAYASLLGQKDVQSWASFTFEEALDTQIEDIEGASTAKRPNQLDRVTRIEQSALNAIAKLREVPPEQFIDPDDEADVNTER